MRQRPFHILLFILMAAAVSLQGCQNDRPEHVLPPDELEDLLYDYHLAQALGRNHRDSAQYYTAVYEGAVFKKYGISAAQFDETLAWYSRHAEELYETYKKVNERLAVATASSTAVNPYAAMREGGDTANVWQGAPFYLLTNHGKNYLTFQQEADTAYHPHDRLILHFNAQWVYREGARDAVATLAVRYANDSLATVTQYLSSHNPQEVTLQTDSLPIKSVSGFVYQDAPWAERPKLLVLTDFALIRIHAALADTASLRRLQPEVRDPQPGLQRTAQQRLRDSLLREDSVARLRPLAKPAQLTTRSLRR